MKRSQMRVNPKATSTISVNRTRRLCLLLVLSCSAFAVYSAPVASAISFGTLGSGAGQTDEPFGVAIDHSNGHVYVADNHNNRIDVFDSAGNFLSAFGWGVADGSTAAPQTCTSVCFKGIAGAAPGQLSSPGSLAIDSDPLSPAYRDIYVVDNGLRVQRFGPAGEFKGAFGTAQIKEETDHVAVGSAGVVYLLDSARPSSGEDFVNKVFRFTPTGALLGTSSLPDTGFVAGIVVNSAGDLYVARAGGIDKYELSEPQATRLAAIAPVNSTTSLAIDVADNLYAAQSEGIGRVVTKYDPAGTPLSRFGYGEIEFNLNGLAVSSDGVYGSEANVSSETFGNKIILIPFPPPGPISCCVQASAVSNTKATLKGQVNPEGKATTYRFDYVDQASFEASGFGDAESTSETSIGEDVSVHSISAAVGCPIPTVPPQPECLTPETKYHYRLVATNSDAPTGVFSEEGTFVTKTPLEVGDTWSTEVGPDSAQLHAAVNPLGIPTTVYFQYVDDATFQVSQFAEATDVPDVSGGAEPLSLGSGEAMKTATAQLSSLAPGTTYHYRVIASNPFATLTGDPHTLITFPLPLAPKASCTNQAFRDGVSARLPDCRAFEMVSPIDKGNADISVRVSAQNYPDRLDLSSSDGNGFSFSSEKSFGDAVSAPYSSQYLVTRVEGKEWITRSISPPRGPAAVSGSVNLKYDVEFKAFTADLSSGWLFHNTAQTQDECAVSDFSNLYRRDNATGAYEALTTAKPTNQIPDSYWPELQGASVDGTHSIFRANAKLTKNAAKITGYQLYEHVAGKEEGSCGELRLVSVLPNGKASTTGASAGTAQNAGGEGRQHALTGAVSTDGSRIFWTASERSVGPLYLRVDGTETLQISANPAQFWAAAPDGSRAIYSVGESLFEYDTASNASASIADGFVGVAGTDEDASHVYFVSTKALGGQGEAGRLNLYLWAQGAASFVTTLAGADGPGAEYSFNGFKTISSRPVERGTRVSADGGELAFVSAASLTGYDNKDAVDGTDVLEIYFYEAESNELFCVSCNPTRGRPRGRQFEGGNEDLRRVAAQMAPAESDLFAPRALSENGRNLFFESFEALVPRDTNGRADVYQWQRAANAADCEEVGAEQFVESAGGCLSLISSGQSPTDSEMIDATADGSDVFFKTASSLLPQDPGLIDIYDARVDGGLPQPPGPPAACEGEACQGPLSPPDAPSPASGAGEFAGNVSPAGKSRCVKPKVRRKGGCAKPTKTRKQAKHHTRASNHRRAGR